MIGVIMWAGCPAQSRFPRLRRDERAQSHTASALRPSGRYFGCRRAGRLDWRQGRSPGYYAESLECRAGRQDAALYGSRMPAAGVWTFSALLNPERMRSLSSGLRAARYPGCERAETPTTLKGLQPPGGDQALVGADTTLTGLGGYFGAHP